MTMSRLRVDAGVELARSIELLFELERNLVASGVDPAVAMGLGEAAITLRTRIMRAREEAGRQAEQAARCVA
jgi:hypothetical protein